MGKKQYDTFIIGHISLDEIIEEGNCTCNVGGAVVYSSYAAAAGGRKVGLITKAAPKDKDLAISVFDIQKEDIYFVPSKNTTSIRNIYLSPDRERRKCICLGHGDAFADIDMPDVASKIYHLAGLIVGDYDNGLIRDLSEKGMLAVDVQGFLRTVVGDEMKFFDWKEKREYLPYIHFFKTDAAEAEILTGTEDRFAAARMLYEWGAKEIMITHNTEVLVYDGNEYFTFPLVPRNLSGRTGRGDSCFSAYITERLDNSPKVSALYAAALVSLKMETPGPFKGTRKDVEDYIREFYVNYI